MDMTEIRNALTEAFGKYDERIGKMESNLIDRGQKYAGMTDLPHGEGTRGNSLGALAVKSDMLGRWKSGDLRVVRAELLCDVKAAIFSNVGDPAKGYPVPPDMQVAGSLAVPRFWRALASRPTTSNAIETVTASPDGATGADAVNEGDLKPEASLSFGPATVNVATIAFWALASRQLMDDSGSFAAYLNGEMRNGLDAKIDDEVINGSGVAPHMTGLVKMATGWTPVAGSIGFDQLIGAVVTLRASGASKVVIGIKDYLATMLVKTTDGSYVISPGANLLASIDAEIVPCSAIASGNFVACGTPEGAYLAIRQNVTLEVSREDRDNFVKNMVTTLVECRMALVVQRPSLCLYGPLAPSATGTSTKKGTA